MAILTHLACFIIGIIIGGWAGWKVAGHAFCCAIDDLKKDYIISEKTVRK
jgi:hypothetical protein